MDTLKTRSGLYDAIIVGARCAGSPTAMLLARKGYRVLLVDRASFPSDTMSTHYIHQHGVSCLQRWGLLDEVKLSNCPPIRTLTIDFGPFTLTGVPPPVHGIEDGYSPRRRILDKTLVDGAVRAGVELRESFRVQDLIFDGQRVVGIRGIAASGASIEERARIVIGADGLRSLVARAVRPKQYYVKPTLGCAYYTYWSGVRLDGFEIYRSNRRLIFAMPTNDGLTCIGVAWPINEWEVYRADFEANYLGTIDSVPRLGMRVRNGRREEPFIGTSALPNFYRKPYGPGWALVGDAGFHKDPTTASGISDAFRDAELLANAIDIGFSGRGNPMKALSRYEQERNRASLPIYRLFTTHIATFQPPQPEFIELLQAVRNNQTMINCFLGALVGAVPVKTVFSPLRMLSIMGIGGFIRALRVRLTQRADRSEQIYNTSNRKGEAEETIL
jgi:flavin-dependent dehydrogenase